MGDRADISVIGIGGAGCNVVDYMLDGGYADLRFIVADTDELSLRNSVCTNRILLGENTKPRPFCHLSPEWCRRAANDDSERLKQSLQGGDLVIIVAGLGGNIGSGVTPVVCRLARESGARACVVVSTPFSFEGRQRRAIAEASMARLREYANEVTAVMGDNVIAGQAMDISLITALKLANAKMADRIVSMMDG